MTVPDKRHHPRIDSLNLIAYSCMDETDQVIAQGMGRTLNVSEGGILLETHIQFQKTHTVSLAIGLQDELIDILGKVVTSMPGKDDNFESGIKFLEIDDATLVILKKYIKAFKGQ